MADESVIFEVQVEKKVLEQIFHENKNIKQGYQHLVEAHDEVKSLNNQIVDLSTHLKDLQRTNDDLAETNTRLKLQMERLQDATGDSTEVRLLELKLHNSESEKGRIIEEYKQQKQSLQELLVDNTKFTHLQRQLKDVVEELERTTKRLTKYEQDNKRLDTDNLQMEMEIKALSTRLRLEEERNKSVDLEHVESKLLKLKLQTVENEKKHLMDDFERERRIILNQNKPRVARMEQNLNLLRKWIEKEIKERHPRQSDEVKALRAQIQTLENDKRDLMEGFEMERKVFRKILKANGGANPPL